MKSTSTAVPASGATANNSPVPQASASASLDLPSNIGPKDLDGLFTRLSAAVPPSVGREAALQRQERLIYVGIYKMVCAARDRDLFQGDGLPDFIFAPRTDAIYNAHGYLTKVPVDGILPYLDAFTAPGDTVVDLFAGSGMTAVAAKIAGRNAVVSDISVLGRHIGEGYLADVDSSVFEEAAVRVIKAAKAWHGDLYETVTHDGLSAPAIRTIWSFVYLCGSCSKNIVYFEALRANNWAAPSQCPHCGNSFSKRNSKSIGDVPVLVVTDGADGKQVERPVTDIDRSKIRKAEASPDLKLVPGEGIGSDREMYRRSALGKWDLDNTRSFFSARNALALYYLWKAIRKLRNVEVRKKLLFAFTAILPRASRRYQWSQQRPLNAATQTYYIAPVYYEWNVFELFARKVRAASRSDAELSARRAAIGTSGKTTQKYVLSSAAKLKHIASGSVDFVFTDPPFGSNLFYADMSLFHEAWLEQLTDDSDEAVIHTNGRKAAGANERYEGLLRAACSEAYRILKPGKCMSIVFGNSSGRIWSMVQNILLGSGFESRPVHIGILDKGQRSVKGLASGFESVSTLDLVLTVRKPLTKRRAHAVSKEDLAVEDLVENAVENFNVHDHQTPSHLYLSLLKEAFERGLPVDEINLSDIISRLRNRNVQIHPKTGEFVRGP
jgi:16S rRNA G966 N2-methylase RsmD